MEELVPFDPMDQTGREERAFLRALLALGLVRVQGWGRIRDDGRRDSVERWTVHMWDGSQLTIDLCVRAGWCNLRVTG
jgi:hypothetical protein